MRRQPRGRAAGRARPQAAARRRRRTEHGRDGCVFAARGPRRRGGRRDPRDRPSAAPRGARTARRALPRVPVRGADADGRWTGAPGVQRPPRRSRGPGHPAATRGRVGAVASRRRARGAAAEPRRGCRCCPGATVGIVLASEGYPEEPRRGDPIRGRWARAATPSSSTPVRAATAGTVADQRRPGRDRRRPRRGPRGSARARPRRPPSGSRSAGSSAATTSRCLRPRPQRPPPEPRKPPEPPDDPAVHPPRDGRDLDRCGAVRADARRRAGRDPSAGPPRRRAGRSVGDHRGARPRRPRAHRRDRAHDRPRRHRVRQPGRRDHRPGRPVSPPGADEQRRRRHRSGPPVARRGRAAAARRRCAPRRPHPPRPRRGEHGPDGPDALGPRGAHHVRAQAGRLGVRGRRAGGGASRRPRPRSPPARSPGRWARTASCHRRSRRRCSRSSACRSIR